MSVSSKFEAADRHFLSQAADPELRTRAIADLKDYRKLYRMLVILSVLVFIGLMFCYGLIQCARVGWVPNFNLSRTPVGEADLGPLFGMIMTLAMGLTQMRSYDSVQNRIRPLLLAE